MIYLTQSTLPSDHKPDISNAVHARHFSALTVFALAGIPNKPTVGPIEGPVFSMSNDVIYDSLDFDIIYAQT
jgi:hypothetical protein